MTDVPGGSRGVAFTNWLVNKAAGVLERKSSRRGFILGSAMVGSAVAVAGCAPATQPGSPYNHITDCASGLCTDGYTEFCCTINNGLNACPSDSFIGGWWRADYSSFCNGTRYYMDCMQYCCGPDLGNGFCAGCSECRCGGGCDTRRVYCNYFRYGQCHTEIGITGPIACRVVTCIPPYTVADYACSTAAAVDNSTAEHAPAHGCATPPSSATAVVGSALTLGPGWISAFVRASDGFIASRLYNGVGWSDWSELPPSIGSVVASTLDPSGSVWLFGRGVDGQLWVNNQANGGWVGDRSVPGWALTSDPATTFDVNSVHVVARGPGGAIAHNRFVSGSGAWTGWNDIGGQVTSNPEVIACFSAVFVFAVMADSSLAMNRWDGLSWSGWLTLGGQLSSDPSATFDGSSLHVFARQTTGSIVRRRFNGTSWSSWEDLGGSHSSGPTALAASDGVYVFTRDTSGHGVLNRNSGGGWTGFLSLGGALTSGIAATVSGPAIQLFARGTDGALWSGRIQNYGWSGWASLGGSPAPLSALS
jgi:hypothetical protein